MSFQMRFCLGSFCLAARRERAGVPFCLQAQRAGQTTPPHSSSPTRLQSSILAASTHLKRNRNSGSAQRRQRTDDDDDIALDGSGGGGYDDDGIGEGADNCPPCAIAAAAVPRVAPPAALADVPAPVTTQELNNSGASRQRAARASRAAVAAAAPALAAAAPPTAPAAAPAPLATGSPAAAAVVKHLSGEDLRALEDWARPVALAAGVSLLGARISPTGSVELAAPSASFLPWLRDALSASARLLLDVGGLGAWKANSKLFGRSALFHLGLGEVFSTVARVEHRLAQRAAAGMDEAPASASASALASLPLPAAASCADGDYSGDSSVLVLWLDPARLRANAVPSLAGPAPFALTLPGGGAPVPLGHGAVLVTAPTRGGGGPGGGASLYTVEPSSSSSSSSATAVAPRGAGTAQGCSLASELIELRLYVSASVARRCMATGEGVVRREVADSFLAQWP